MWSQIECHRIWIDLIITFRATASASTCKRSLNHWMCFSYISGSFSGRTLKLRTYVDKTLDYILSSFWTDPTFGRAAARLCTCKKKLWARGLKIFLGGLDTNIRQRMFFFGQKSNTFWVTDVLRLGLWTLNARDVTLTRFLRVRVRVRVIGRQPNVFLPFRKWANT